MRWPRHSATFQPRPATRGNCSITWIAYATSASRTSTRATRRYLAPAARLEVHLVSDSSSGIPRETVRTAFHHAAHYLRWHLAPDICRHDA